MKKICKVVGVIVMLLISIPLLNYGILKLSAMVGIPSGNVDILMYILQLIQVGIGSFLSYLVYRSSRRDVAKEERRIKQDVLLGIKYVRNEINYNMCLIKLMNKKSFDFKYLESDIFESSAWQKYSTILLDKLDDKIFNKFLSYYAAISLCEIDEFQKDAIDKVKNAEELLRVLDSVIDDMK